MKNMSMKNKTCLITGATDGQGKALAKALAFMQANVIIHGRNPEKCKKVQQEINQLTGNKPDILICDLSSQKAINLGCQEFLNKYNTLHLFINNAGLVSQQKQLSEDGIELNFAVNYLAVFQMTLSLLELIIKSAPARIINISSGAHKISPLNLSDLEAKNKKYFFMGAYGRSKLALIYFTIELAKKLKNFNVTVNAVNPGPIRSSIANKPGIIPAISNFIIQKTFPTPEKACQTALYLATAEEPKKITGQYFQYMQSTPPQLNQKDPEFGQKLWERSLSMINDKNLFISL